MQFDKDTIEEIAQAIYGEYHHASETLVIWDGGDKLKVYDSKGGLVGTAELSLSPVAKRNPHSHFTITLVKERIGEVKNSLAHDTQYSG